jgi:hypothetical protein
MRGKSLILTNFATAQGRNCIFGNVYNTVHYLQMDLREQDLFFWFSIFQGSRTVSELFETLYEKNGETDLRRFVMHSLEAGQPVLTHIDPKVLPYITYSTLNPSAGHYINIIGFDARANKLCVSDSYIPTYKPSTYTGWIDCPPVPCHHIEACWRINSGALQRFFVEQGASISDFTRANIVRRLSDFLIPNEANDGMAGITELSRLPDTIGSFVQNKDYEEILKLLAGIRLHIINPLIYLRIALERLPDSYGEFVKNLDKFIESEWEASNMQLIKFAVAHKHLEGERIALKIQESVQKEEEVLTTIMERLKSGKHDVEERNEVL